MNVTVFEAINITKKYRNTLALNQVSMSVMQGDIYGFIGENGAGKTTMIRLLTGLAEPTTGKIALFGESNKKLAKQRERIGCIIESPSLYLDMTAYENLEVQRLQRGIPGKGCIDNSQSVQIYNIVAGIKLMDVQFLIEVIDNCLKTLFIGSLNIDIVINIRFR